MSTPPSKICHLLPCNIDYNGMAPVHVYFHPSKDGEVHFRGHRLVSTAVKPVRGLVEAGGKQISISGIQEWNDPAAPSANKSRVDKAQAWFKVARAAHEELEVVD